MTMHKYSTFKVCFPLYLERRVFRHRARRCDLPAAVSEGRAGGGGDAPGFPWRRTSCKYDGIANQNGCNQIWSVFCQPETAPARAQIQRGRLAPPALGR
jgi:hypothetical protein